MAYTAEEQKLYDFARSALPRHLFAKVRPEEFMGAFVKVFDGARQAIADFFTQAFITTATGVGADYLNQHARDRGTMRAAGESDASLRSRLRNIPDAVTRPALLNQADDLLTSPYTSDMIEAQEMACFMLTTPVTPGDAAGYGFLAAQAQGPDNSAFAYYMLHRMSSFILFVPGVTPDDELAAVTENTRQFKAGGIRAFVRRALDEDPFAASVEAWRASRGMEPPLLVWPCQDPVGGTGNDEILEVLLGGPHFELVDQEPTAQQPAEIGRAGVLFDANDEGISALGSFANIPVGSGATLIMRVKFPTLAIGTATLMEFDGGGNGSIRCSTAGLLSFNNIEDADSNGASGTIVGQDHQDGWHWVLLVIDADTGAEFEVTLRSDLGSVGPVAASGGGSAENPVNLNDLFLMTIPREGFVVSYVAWLNYALSASEQAEIVAINPASLTALSVATSGASAEMTIT